MGKYVRIMIESFGSLIDFSDTVSRRVITCDIPHNTHDAFALANKQVAEAFWTVIESEEGKKILHP